MLVWERKEVQEMPRFLALFALLAVLLPAAILPEGIEGNSRKSAVAVMPAEEAIFRDYGFQDGERAEYAGKDGKFAVTAWRLNDSTGAFALFQYLRPADSKPSPASRLAAVKGNQLWVELGNYVLEFNGFKPQEETLNQLMLAMPRYETSSLPALTGFLPKNGRIPNSERYILGPASLERFEPKIPPSVAAFQFGAEAQVARYRDKDGEVQLTVFNYPNHQVAKARIDDFQKIPGITAKRSGPLVATVSSAPNPDAAQRVLADVQYQATVTLNQRPPTKDENMGDILISIFKLTGILIVFCVLAGLLFAGFRILSDRFWGGGGGQKGDQMIVLHIDSDSKSS
jgi:hypothetical protein